MSPDHLCHRRNSGHSDLLGEVLPSRLANLAVDTHVRDDLDPAIPWRHIDQYAGAGFGQVHTMRQELFVRLPACALGCNRIRHDAMPD